LVITGFANEAPLKKTEHLQAESFVRQYIQDLKLDLTQACKLIFTPGIDGLSALQLAAAELDVHMVLALLLPFTNNLDEVHAKLQAIAERNDLTPEEQWQQHTSLLLKSIT